MKSVKHWKYTIIFLNLCTDIGQNGLENLRSNCIQYAEQF